MGTNKIVFLILLLLIIVGCKQSNTLDKSTALEINNEQAMVVKGKAIYNKKCSSCHLSTGKGVVGAFPPLNPSDWITDKREASIRAIKYGLRGPIQVNGKPYDNIMLPLGLSDHEVTDVMNYIITEWNKGIPVTLQEVQSIREN